MPKLREALLVWNRISRLFLKLRIGCDFHLGNIFWQNLAQWFKHSTLTTLSIILWLTRRLWFFVFYHCLLLAFPHQNLPTRNNNNDKFHFHTLKNTLFSLSNNKLKMKCNLLSSVLFAMVLLSVTTKMMMVNCRQLNNGVICQCDCLNWSAACSPTETFANCSSCNVAACRKMGGCCEAGSIYKISCA
jgi:hypothetical protein